MSKRTCESGSSEQKKATAKADAPRAVTEKTKPMTQFFSVPEGSTVEVATNSQCRSRLRQDPAFFFWTRRGSQKFVKNRTRSHFTFSASRVCVAFICGIS